MNKDKEFEIICTMKLFQIFQIGSLFCNLQNIFAFTPPLPPPLHPSSPVKWREPIQQLKYSLHENSLLKHEPQPHQSNKIKSLLKLIRYKNIIPTVFLSFSGGWIMNPSFTNLVHSIPFIISIIDTVLIMSASMALNDIYDVEIDKINSPNRPLVNGELKKYEAILFSLLLVGICEYMTLRYLPNNLKFIIQMVMIQISIYTPILKKIPVLKNISCASLISFSLFFSGLAASTNKMMSVNKNIELLSVGMTIIFFGSLSNELLLDMRDKEGDQQNHIATIPTIFGNQFSWLCSNLLLSLNVIINTTSIVYLYTDKVAVFLPIIFSPLFFNLYKIKKDNYSQDSIAKYMKKFNYSFFALILYLCFIAKMK